MELENQDTQITDSNLNTESTSEFSIPQEYQDKGWTKFFDGKTGEELKTELFKSYDNQQALIGKKVGEYIGSTDLTTLDNWEELKEKFISMVTPQYKTPQEITAYELEKLLLDDDGNQTFSAPQEALDYFGNEFKNLGLNIEQAQGLFKKYMQFETEQFQKHTNADELEKNINQMFAGNTKQRQNCESLIREFLPQEDQQFIQDVMPNNVVEMFYKIAKGMEEKYGYKESTTKDNPTRLAMSTEEKKATYNDLYDKLLALSSRPHTSQEKQDILNQMQNLYK